MIHKEDCDMDESCSCEPMMVYMAQYLENRQTLVNELIGTGIPHNVIDPHFGSIMVVAAILTAIEVLAPQEVEGPEYFTPNYPKWDGAE